MLNTISLTLPSFLFPGYLEIVKTPKGMSHPKWSKWGNLQFSTTAAFLALAHAKHSKSAESRAVAVQWARSQVDYAMGSRYA